MGAFLIDNPPKVQQWYAKRNRPLTGCTVLHTAEGVLDTIGPDTGAEATANFIRSRTTAGSYHDLVDSDSWVPLIPYQHGAFHDGTGSNNWALSISFACRTTDWRTMPAEKRRGFLRQGARAFAAQQAYRRSIGAPLTELRLISKKQSDNGESGLTYHGFRDPGRRSDPGVATPNLFPFDEFIAECRVALGQAPAPAPTAPARTLEVPVFVQLPVGQAVNLPVPAVGAGQKAVLVVSTDSVSGARIYSKAVTRIEGKSVPLLEGAGDWTKWLSPGFRDERDVTKYHSIELVANGTDTNKAPLASAVISIVPA